MKIRGIYSRVLGFVKGNEIRDNIIEAEIMMYFIDRKYPSPVLHDAYFNLLKCNKMGVICIKMIEDAEIFPNGRKDIYRVPNSIIHSGCGLIGDYSRNNIERYVQKPKYNGKDS